MFMDITVIRIVNMYVDTRGENLEKSFLLVTWLMETFITVIGIDLTLKASFDVVDSSCLEDCVEKDSETCLGLWLKYLKWAPDVVTEAVMLWIRSP